MKKKTAILGTILLLLAVVFLLLLRNAGTYLIYTNTPAKADAIVLLMGGLAPDRILETADVYKNGLAPRLILVQENRGPYQELEKRGVHLHGSTAQTREALITLGIPSDSITLLPGDARSTQQEAILVRGFLTSHPEITSLILVTSSDHTRRAAMIFQKAFKKHKMPVTVYSCPSKYSSFTGKGWWKNKEGIQTVLMEYLKLANFMLFEKRKL